MTKIAVFGSSGQLGGYVTKYFQQQGYYVTPLTSKNADIQFIAENSDFNQLGLPDLREFDAIINAAGTIKPQVDKVGVVETLRVNSIFPRVLANFCENYNIKCIHASSDCCFSGKVGNYTVKDKPDAEDLYGQSKVYGEPENAIVVRTSIIGEASNGRGLVEWVKANAGKTINGFTNHYWNGNTSLTWAKFAKFCIEGNLPYLTYHLTGQSVNKYTLLDQINSAYNLGITIKSVEDSTSIDRTLVSNCQHLYSTPGLREQLEEMKDFGPTLRG